MLNTTTFVGLDVHARSIKAVALDAMTGEVRSATARSRRRSRRRMGGILDPAAKCVLRVRRDRVRPAEEARGAGRRLRRRRGFEDDQAPADRKRKNDRNDAEFLARMLSVGNVIEVWVPDDECEAARDLVRALDDARDDLRRCKQRLSKFLLRHGLVFDETTPSGQRKGNWTAAHWAWINAISFEERADNEVLAYYVDAVRQKLEDKKRLEALVKDEASKARWRKRVDSIRCLKGIDVMSAADLVFEAGEFSRFKNARSFGAWLGLTPSEHSSGESVRQGGITKAGNKHLRRVLVESAWHYLNASAHSKDLAKGQIPDLRQEGTRLARASKTREEARGDAGARRPQEQGQCRHGQRTRGLGLGRRLHSRERLGHRNDELNQHRGTHIPSCGQIRGRWG